jgi:type I restriction enzyme, S subunit
MSKQWPTMRLGDVLGRSEETIEPQAETEYREITVRLWGKGVTERGRITGTQISGRRFVARTGQFIASRIDARNGAMGLVPASLDGALVTNDFPLFNLNAERLEPAFLGWLCRTADFVELCLRASEGTTNRVRLKEDRFLALEIPLPPLAEQRRVVARIEELAAQIHEARTLRHQAAEEAEALYPQQLGEAMTPHGEGWKRETVADVIKSMDAGWSPQCDDIPASEGKWGVLKTTAVQWCDFQPQHNKALPTTLKPIPEFSVKEGDVLVTRAGPRKRVAVVAAVRRDEPRLTISDKLIRLRTDRTRIEPRFLELSLASPFSQEHLVQRKTGLADAQVNISQAILKATPIAYPPLDEQRQIVAELDALQVEVDALKRLQAQTAAELHALLPAILDRAFKGEL